MDRNLFFQISRNTISQAFGKLASSVSTLLITVLITRQLGIIGYGDFIKAFSFVTLFYMVADFGFNATILKIFNDNTGKIKSALASLLGLRIVLSLIIIIVLITISFFLPFDLGSNQGFNPMVKKSIIILAFTVFFQSLFLSANSYFQYLLKYHYALLATVASSLVTVIAVFVFTNTKPTISSVSTAYLIGSLVLGVTSYLVLSKKIGLLIPSFNFKNWLSLSKKTLPIGIALIFNLIYFRVDTLIIAFYRPTEEVAVYGLAYKIFEIALVPPIFFINALYPVLIQSVSQNLPKLLKIVKISFWLLLLVSILLSTILFFISKFLVLLLGGGQLVQSTPALQLLVVGLPFFYLSALSMWLLVVFDRQKTLLLIYSLGAFLNIVANLLLIPTHGYIVASATTIFSEFLILIVSFTIVIPLLKKSVLENAKINK